MTNNLYNYYALAVSVLTDCFPEQALAIIAGEAKPYANAFVDEMQRHRQAGLTWREIGDLFGISGKGAYNSVRRARQRTEEIKHVGA
jgi:hypothetical protein